MKILYVHPTNESCTVRCFTRPSQTLIDALNLINGVAEQIDEITDQQDVALQYVAKIIEAKDEEYADAMEAWEENGSKEDEEPEHDLPDFFMVERDKVWWNEEGPFDLVVIHVSE